MITSLQAFKESLSGDKAREAKIRMLIQTTKEFLDAKSKAEEFELLKKESNKEVQQLLEKFNQTSVIANNTLIEVVYPFTSNKLKTKEYMDFIETSAATISEEFKKVHDEVVKLSTKMGDAVEYLRGTENKKGLPTGTLKKNESLISDVWDKVSNWFIAFKQKFNRLVSGAQEKFAEISAKAKQFKPVAEGKINESTDPSVDDIAAILEKAKKALEYAKEQTYYEELKAMKQEMIISLLKEFDAKSIAIDDKIISLISIAPKPKLDLGAYTEYITNAEKVDKAVAEMASNLMSIHTEIVETSGSVRHYKDDKDLPEGTFGATWDWVKKEVIPPATGSETPSRTVPTKESILSDVGSIIKKYWNKLKSFFVRFKVASKKCDDALSAISV